MFKQFHAEERITSHEQLREGDVIEVFAPAAEKRFKYRYLGESYFGDHGLFRTVRNGAEGRIQDRYLESGNALLIQRG